MIASCEFESKELRTESPRRNLTSEKPVTFSIPAFETTSISFGLMWNIEPKTAPRMRPRRI